MDALQIDAFQQQGLLAERCAGAGISLSQDKSRKSRGNLYPGSWCSHCAREHPGPVQVPPGEGCKAQLGNVIFLCSPHLLAPNWNLRVFLHGRQVLNGLKRCPCHSSLFPTPRWGQAGLDGGPGSGHFTPWEHPQGRIPSSSQDSLEELRCLVPPAGTAHPSLQHPASAEMLTRLKQTPKLLGSYFLSG